MTNKEIQEKLEEFMDELKNILGNLNSVPIQITGNDNHVKYARSVDAIAGLGYKIGALHDDLCSPEKTKKE